MDGVIVVNKEKGMSSHDVVFKLRKILKTKKVGHCGTLDPMVDGVLVCVVNKGCKIASLMTLDTKEYVATLRLGQASTTQDLEGEIIEEKEFLNDLTIERINEVFQSFIGKQKQIPSIYSAIKVNGKKLYEYARANEEVEIPVRDIEIFDIEILNISNNEITFKTNCGSGTYIRSLCFDIAKKLGYPGLMSSLTRTRSGRFTIDKAYTLSEITNEQFEVIDIAQALSINTIIVDDEQIIKDIKNGKVFANSEVNIFLVSDSEGNVLAVYHPNIDGYSKIIRGLW